MKIACLSLAGVFVAMVASGQEGPVQVTGVMLAGPGAPAGVARSSINSTSAPTTAQKAAITSKLGSLQPQVSAISGITYTCDQTIINAGTQVCNTLNTTIAAIYSSVFSNANARIYIKLGGTGLGASSYLTYPLSYSSFRTALQNNQTDADDIAALTYSVKASNPIAGNPTVYVTSANYRALGFTPATGMQSDGSTQCSMGGDACYDGVITLSDAVRVGAGYYYRDSNQITSGQYDFYSVVEHETDEILGTGSCAFGCFGSNAIAPADLFRYQSNGVRSTTSGNNTSCSVAVTGNACFSLDGVQMLQQYNNVVSGGDAGDWFTNCQRPLVQDAFGCLGVANLDISPAAEIRVLDVVGYTLASPVTVRVVNKTTSDATGIVNGVCSTPQPVSNFTITSPQVWVYFSVTGVNVGDKGQITFIRPDGTVYTIMSTSQVTSPGTQCFSNSIGINGFSAASYPGTWTVQTSWDNQPLFSLNFNVSSATCSYSLDSSGQSFPAAGGQSNITVTVAPGCPPWSVSNIPTWVVPVGFGGSGTSTLSYTVVENAGAARSGTMTVAGVTYTIEQQSFFLPIPFLGSMPHLAAEENWTTSFTILNKGTIPAQARLSFFGDPADASGTGPLTLPITFPQQPAAAAPLLASSIDRTLAPNASVVVTTAGPQNPPVQVGSAQLNASNNVDGFAIFHLIPGAQEAVVPLTSGAAPSYVLAYDHTNGVVLGVAVANVSSQDVTIPVIIRASSGAVISNPSESLTVPANGHISFVLSQKYPITVSSFYLTGSIEFDTPQGGQISVLGIRTTPLGNSTTLTTVPALANVGTNGGSIAHLATGNGWQTTIVLVNTGVAPAEANLSFFSDSGAPLPLPITMPPSQAVTVVSTVKSTLAQGGMLLVQSVKPASDPTPTTGSAQLTITGNAGNISGFVIFRYNPNGQEAVVPLESRTANARILAFDNTNGAATGVALNSVSAANVAVPVVVRDDAGNLITTDTITLSANGHYSFTLGVDRYPQMVNSRGTIEFDTPPGGQIGALGIRIPAAHTFTTLPALVR